MSLLLYDGEIIEIPEYIVRIVTKAQQIVASENDHSINIVEGGVLSKFIQDADSEPTVIGPDGYTRTVSEYILDIIRTAQKIVLEDHIVEDDIKDYDEFIDSTFDSMLDEVDSDTDSSFIVQNVVEKLIDEVCNTKITMPEMENSLVSIPQEDVTDSTENQQISQQLENVPVNSDIVENNAVKDEIVNVANNDETKETNDKAVEVEVETVQDSSYNTVTPNQEIIEDNDEKLKSQDDSEKVNDSNSENIPQSENKIDEKTTENTQEVESKDISSEELEKVAEKFVESICEDAKNEIAVEQENKTNEMMDSNTETEKDKEENTEKSEVTDATETPNGQVDQKQDGETVDIKVQNHSAKVHPEETKPVVTNLEDITQSESLPTEGKPGKEQKSDVTKDKIKPKRRARGLRNSFRRMFSCFSTKSSQLE